MPSTFFPGPQGPSASQRGRHAPLWVRELTERNLHALCGHLARTEESQDLTASQVWLYEHCLDDLEWRRKHTFPVWHRCSCRFCFAPF